MEKYPILTTDLKETTTYKEQNLQPLDSPLYVKQDIGFNLYAYQTIDEKCRQIKEQMKHKQTNQMTIKGINFLLIGDILYVKQKTKDILLEELKLITRIMNERNITPLIENKMLNDNPTITDEIDNIIRELGITPPTP